jgi:hypothetical protein
LDGGSLGTPFLVNLGLVVNLGHPEGITDRIPAQQMHGIGDEVGQGLLNVRGKGIGFLVPDQGNLGTFGAFSVSH